MSALSQAVNDLESALASAEEASPSDSADALSDLMAAARQVLASWDNV